MKATNAAQHLRIWLAASGLTYGYAARERFVLAHPALFGRAYQLTLRGYDHWRKRQGLFDSVEAFSDYIGSRHKRWMAGNASSNLPPCLLGSNASSPCWRTASPGEPDVEMDLGLAA